MKPGGKQSARQYIGTVRFPILFRLFDSENPDLQGIGGTDQLKNCEPGWDALSPVHHPAPMAPLSPTFFRNGTLLSTGLLSLVVLALLPPFVSSGAADILMAAFAPVCHQLPDRSLHIDDTALAVCHRCFGAYVGLFAGSLVYLFSKGSLLSQGGILSTARPILLLWAAAIPGVIDWVGDIVGFWTNSPVSRMSTGAWFGVLAGVLLASAILDRKRTA
jgi:uncharacterized membrane protein